MENQVLDLILGEQGGLMALCFGAGAAATWAFTRRLWLRETHDKNTQINRLLAHIQKQDNYIAQLTLGRNP